MIINIFNDNLDVIDSSVIIVDAELSLLNECEGGRKFPFNSGYSPNHNFGDQNNSKFYIGRIMTKNNSYVYPGSIVNIQIIFLNVSGLDSDLRDKGNWTIQEGFKIIGYARVSKISSVKN